MVSLLTSGGFNIGVGNTFSAGFVCVSTTASIKGSYLDVDSSLPTAGGSLSDSDSTYTTHLSSCIPLSAAEKTLVDWVSGPKAWFCYVGCRYGTIPAQVDNYVNRFTVSELESPHTNAFLMTYLLAPLLTDPTIKTDLWMKLVCVSECPHGLCNATGYYRPLVQGTCGPACALPGNPSPFPS